MSAPANALMALVSVHQLNVTISERTESRSRIAIEAPKFPGVRKYEAKPVALTYSTYSSLRARRISARHSLSTGICSLRYYRGSSASNALREGSERDFSSKHLTSGVFCAHADDNASERWAPVSPETSTPASQPESAVPCVE